MRLNTSPVRQLIVGTLVVAVAIAITIAVLSSSSAGPPPRHLDSIFQDDDHLVYTTTPVATATLDRLERLGVDTIRVTMLWKAIAPQPTSATAPAGFKAADPAAYPAAGWAPYDRLVELARARGITVLFNITAPGPAWAMARGATPPGYADHWMPSAAAFGQFVAAAGQRFSGSYRPPGSQVTLPAVRDWSIWNEPNQPGWLAPQLHSEGGLAAPALYRSYVSAAFSALSSTGHRTAHDTFLIGELAPEGCEPGKPCVFRGPDRPIPPIPFVRALYCVGSSYRPLTGAAAASAGCPQSGDRRAFVAANPGLFRATGFAHHPYSFFLGPAMSMPDPNFVPLADLARLERALDGAFRAYGVARRLDLYLTEYGYETNPPNPYRGVTPATQARYLNEAQYMAWRDPRVRALSQFLMYDAPPDARFKPGSLGYWSTFQTGLAYQNGLLKPSYAAYRVPVFVPDQSVDAGRPVLVWGMLRPAPSDSSQHAEVEWRAGGGGSFRSLTSVSVQNPTGALSVKVRVPGSGMLRIAWRAPGGVVYYSREVEVRAR